MQINFKKVTKEYDQGLKALDNLSFEIERGDFVFIVGESGAGKSTLVKLLIREELPSSGQIMVEDEDVSLFFGDQVSALRRKIGVVFQDFKLLESKNVFDNVAVALEVVDSDEQVVKDVVPNVLSLVGLTEKMFKFPNQLSGGEKQRVSIARALAHEPDVLVADEPTGMIDPRSSAEIMDILHKINSLGTTILMATHDSEIVNAMRRRVLTLKEGKLISDKKKGKYNA